MATHLQRRGPEPVQGKLTAILMAAFLGAFAWGCAPPPAPPLCGWRTIAKFGSSVGSAGQPRKSRRLLHIKRRQASPRRTAAGNWTKRISKRIPTASGYRELRLDAFRQGLLTCAHEGSAKMS